MSSKQKQKKGPLIITASVAVLVGVGMGVAIPYFIGKQAGDATKTDSATVVASTPRSVIEHLQKTPPTALGSYTIERADATQAIALSIKQNNKPYGLMLPAQSVVVFSAAQGAERASDAPTIISGVTEALKPFGLQSAATFSSGETYAGNDMVCQVDVQTAPLSVTTIGCTANNAIEAAYMSVGKLITLYNEKAEAGSDIVDPLQIAYRTLEKDGITGAVLSVQYPEGSSGVKNAAYLFGTEGEQWQYVANLSGGENTGKASVPTASLGAIRDPRWKGVLVELTGVEYE